MWLVFGQFRLKAVQLVGILLSLREQTDNQIEQNTDFSSFSALLHLQKLLSEWKCPLTAFLCTEKELKFTSVNVRLCFSVFVFLPELLILCVSALAGQDMSHNNTL